MQKIALIFGMLLLSSAHIYAQGEKRTMQSEHYKGSIEANPNEFLITTLALKHEPNANLGTFTLKETDNGPHPDPMVTEGDYSTIKGDATDKNAKVIELNANGGRMLYYLCLKNGNLQHLDFQLRELKPVASHLLRKQ